MPLYRISEAARLIGVSSDTMRRWTDAGRVQSHQDGRGRRSIEGTELARLAIELADGPEARYRLSQSSRNHLSGIVTRVKKDEVAAQVELQAGPYRLVALITREAVDDLGIEPGVMADAVVKATSVSIEVHPGR